MTPEIKAIERALKKRQIELHELIQQMKADQLAKSSLYKSLEQELESIAEKLKDTSRSQKK
jgi:signal transduction histidine kinase